MITEEEVREVFEKHGILPEDDRWIKVWVELLNMYQGRISSVEPLVQDELRKVRQVTLQSLELLIQTSDRRFEELHKRLNQMQNEWNQRFSDLQKWLDRRFSELVEGWNQRFAELREDLDRRFTHLEDGWNRRFAELREDLDKKFTRLEENWNRRFADLIHMMDRRFGDLLHQNRVLMWVIGLGWGALLTLFTIFRFVP